MAKHIHCALCRYARPDRRVSVKPWIAYACTNRNSEFFKALLNITPEGDHLPGIPWMGCVWGELRNRGAAC
jgi:hypothetical protein